MEAMNEKNPLFTFFAGLIMLVAGLYWLFNSVVVESFGWGFGSFRLGGISVPSGLVVVPLIVGVFWLVVNPKSFFAKILAVAGVVVIVASVIASVRLRFESKTLYEYIIMLVLIVAGAGLLARVLLMGDGSSKEDKDKKNRK